MTSLIPMDQPQRGTFRVPARYWPPEVLAQLRAAGVSRVPVRLASGEKDVLRRRKPMRVSEWAAKYRTVAAKTSATPGPWRNDLSPHLVGIMDAIDFPSVRRVILCAAPQTGKSEVINNYLGYRADYRPAPAMCIYPAQREAGEHIKDRVLPMFRDSPRLRRYLTGDRDDESSFRVNLRHMMIYGAWATSASRTASKYIGIILADEVDKFEATAGDEGDVDAYIEKRGRTDPGLKYIKASSPTTEKGRIWLALTNEAQAVFGYAVACPDCGNVHEMDFTSIRWPGRGKTPPVLYANEVESKDLARYHCPACGSVWDDMKRNRAARHGEWRDRKTGMELFTYLETYRPRNIGIHLPAWPARVPLSECAAAFLRGQKCPENPKWREKLRDFTNGYAAESWTDVTEERSEDRILALRDDRPRGLVPGNGVVSCITAGVDTQDERNGFVYSIRAWGWGLTLESWQIAEGYVDTFEALAQVLWGQHFQDAAGTPYPLRLALMDAMGNRTAAVYEFCRARRGAIFPCQGVARLDRPHKFSVIDTWPGTNKPIPGGIKLLRHNTTYYKNLLASKLEISPHDPGAFHLNAATSEDYAKQMTAEYVNESGVWVCPKGKPNHAWDTESLNLVAADLLRVSTWPRQARESERPQVPEVHKPADNPYTGGENYF